MSLTEFNNAQRLGKKQYADDLAKEVTPFLPVLDEIIKDADIVSELNLGTMLIPLENVVGTKTMGRREAFARNFMPLLDEQTEFSYKWRNVYEYQVEQGIDDPILVYEYMNRFYVQEGNKRVSVLKYLKAYNIMASVIRLIPRRSDHPDVRLYYEFLDFYQLTANYSIQFDQEGNYLRLIEAMGIDPDTPMDKDEQKCFRQVCELFNHVFESSYSKYEKLSTADAFLKYVELLTYPVVKERTESQMKEDFKKIHDELLLAARGNEIELVTQPKEAERSGLKLLNWLRPTGKIEPEMLKIAFIYPKTAETSRWTYGHELGRTHLEASFDGNLKNMVYDQADNDEKVKNKIEEAIANDCNVIFAVGPQMATECVKAAVQHPEVRIFNCSVNMSFSSICNYYPRMFESKFLMGALAAAMSETDKIGYLADYPIYGMVANINAFALGAAMINPRVKVHLNWVGLSDESETPKWDDDIQIISGVDMIVPQNASREYGLYRRFPDGKIENLAVSFCHWGKFYERIIQQICARPKDEKELKGKKASNYWWGMSADVIDTIYSDNLPNGTRRLVNFLSSSIRNGIFHPFAGKVYEQGGKIISEEGNELPLMDIVQMNWLAGNIIGEIPPIEAFKQEAQTLIRLQGVKSKADDTDTEE
ncbi:MAG: BMP family ABC transporter substrate-binding protein [Roseburia sp.]|nr:BMP family ABC transporter substrate-binding protein [Roseburia sp.]